VSTAQRIRQAIAWRTRNASLALYRLPGQVPAWVSFQRHKGRYQLLSESELRVLRKSDTVFIFGSGGSLNEMSRDEWQQIEAFDTLGFNWFVHQQFVRLDFHVVRELGEEKDWRRDIVRYFDLIRSNHRFANTTFLVQTGFEATNGNRAIGLRMLPEGSKLFLFRSLRNRPLPGESFAEGISHAEGTLSDAINIAALIGWRHIVLCGVDLYNRQYFWLPEGEPRYGDTTTSGHHNTAMFGIVETIRAWREFYDRRGVTLHVYNPKSLLAQVLPIWQRPPQPSRA
jgi:hypothetical protein